MLTARFADIEIGIKSLSHEGGQDWAESSPTRGDQHVLMPRGRRMRRTACEIEFVGRDFEKKLSAFDQAVTKDEPALFVHPLRGSYRAVAKDWTYSVSDVADYASGSCVFVEYESPRAVTPVSAGVVAIAGPGAMRVAVQRTIAAAGNDRGLIATLGAALAAVEEWAAEDSDLRSVQTRLSSLTSTINAKLDSLKPTTWESWKLYRELLRTRAQLQSAGEAVVAEYSVLIDAETTTAEPLIAFARRLFGGAQARERAEEIKRLNGIKTPGMIPAGTKLKVMPP